MDHPLMFYNVQGATYLDQMTIESKFAERRIEFE